MISDINNCDLEKCVEWIKSNSYKTICLQFPENLMKLSVRTSLFLKKHLKGVKVFIIGDPTVENCCIDNLNAQHVNADALIHFGHACLTTTKHLPTFYVFAKENLNLEDFYNKFEAYFDDKNEQILLFYDTDISHIIENIYNKLKSSYTAITLTQLLCTSNIKVTDNDQSNLKAVSGRTYPSTANIDPETCKALFIGTNEKSLVPLSIGTDIKNWYHYDGQEIKKYEIYSSPYFKKRNFLIEKIKDSKTFGIIVPTINVEDIVPITEKLKSILQEMNKKTYTISIGKINPEKLANFQEIDIFITLTCPEIALNSYHGYFKPIVIPGEIEMAFNGARNCYDFPAIDFRQILPGGSRYVEFQPKEMSDVSLVCGKIRNSKEPNLTDNENLTVSNVINSDFLQMREWYGLDFSQDINKEPSIIEMGRDGIPVNYINEKNQQ